MQTKFKKGDRVVAIADGFFYTKGMICYVEEVDDIIAKVRIGDGTKLGIAVSDLELIKPNTYMMPETIMNEAGYTPAPLPRLASEMTLREKFDAAKDIYMELIQLGRPAGSDTAKAAVKAVQTIIQALNEKP